MHDLIARKESVSFNVDGEALILRFEFELWLEEELNPVKGLINPGLLTDQIYLVRHPLNMSLFNRKVCKLLRRKLSGVGENIAKFRGREGVGLTRKILAL